MLAQLSDPEVYRVAFERVRQRQLRRRDQTPLTAAGPSILQLAPDGHELLKRLAREVSTQYYAFGPVVAREVRISGKQRILYRASPLDDIVLGALARVLGSLVEPSLSPCLYSYRTGRSAKQALHALRAYLQAHRRARPDPRTRGLYVIRRDIVGYGDAIPVGRGSRLWQQLTAALAHGGVRLDERASQWLRAAFRPPLLRGAWLEEPQRGVPTGSPLQPLACNLYLASLDAACSNVPGAFYARFGDDILFAHPERALSEATLARIDEELAALGLAAHPGKSCERFWSGAGRPGPAPFSGSHTLEYLGVRVDFQGRFGLKRDKLRALLRDVRARLARSAELLEDASEPQRLSALGEVLAQALHAGGPLAERHAQLLLLVDDRGQLRDLDQQLWRALAQSVSGERSLRAFRRFPPRRLRAEANAPSLVARRNRRGAGA